ncbi:RNA polymerase sigma factor [Xylophilus sp.]|uniref:RNA polymerase sigma factor n=1 Tax=Xylophilus sp. TaxID=2653893 RepID=UPI003FCD39DD
MRIVRDSQAAEDVAQETYIRASKAIENGPIEHVEAFLFQTARNLALNHKRRCNMRGGIEREDVSDDDIANVAASIPSRETALIHRQRLHCVDAAIAKLPERARTVWLLSRIEKWPYPKIAEHLGVSPKTVFNDLKLAHAHCLDALAKIDRD